MLCPLLGTSLTTNRGDAVNSAAISASAAGVVSHTLSWSATLNSTGTPTPRPRAPGKSWRGQLDVISAS